MPGVVVLGQPRWLGFTSAPLLPSASATAVLPLACSTVRVRNATKAALLGPPRPVHATKATGAHDLDILGITRSEKI